ncbi:maleylpyruvate isomerase N-terminal domain-containing protein [Streptomyces sp. NPDC054784]
MGIDSGTGTGRGAGTGAGAVEAAAERFIEGLLTQTARFADAVRDGDADATVPTCPDWALRQLTAHVGQAHRWGAAIVRSGRPDAVPDPAQADPGEPAAWADWLNTGAAELAAAVRDIGPVTVVWTLVGERPAAFWPRRMLHDTSVHYADALLTGAGAGADTSAGLGYAIDADLAADALNELLEIAGTPAAVAALPGFAQLRGEGQTLSLRPDEKSVPGWLVTRTPEGVSWRHVPAADPAPEADVTVSGSVADVMLVLARRLPADSPAIKITGDRALVDHWLSHTAL